MTAKRGRKRNRPGRNVGAMATREKIALLGATEMARLKDAWMAVFSQKLAPAAALKRLARDLPYYSAPAPTGAGRRRDPNLERAARLYVAAVETKDAMRALGIGGLKPEKAALQTIATQCFPDAQSAAALAKAQERIKNAARKYRQK